MSGDGSKTLAWGDGEYKFRLGIGELREMQDKCGAGPFQVYQRLADGSWRVDDVREPLRLGLIGGGLSATQALGKVGRYVAPGAYLENVIAARQVLLAALFGDPDDIVGKMQAAVEPAASTLAEGSDGQNSSATPPPWDGASPSSTNARSGNSPPRSTDGNAATGPRNSGQNG